MNNYKALKHITHHHEGYESGELIELTKEQAAPLISSGAIDPDPSNPNMEEEVAETALNSPKKLKKSAGAE